MSVLKGDEERTASVIPLSTMERTGTPRSKGWHIPLTLPFLVFLGAATAAGPVMAQQTHAAGASEQRSLVSYRDGVLYVEAVNASLNGLVREIARQTGMRISGRVTEDRVFGNYGPADPQKVLATLLDGTGTNLLILSSSADTPLRLILSPRVGGVTPPSARQSNEGEDADEEPPPASRPPQAISAPAPHSPGSPDRDAPGGVQPNPAATQPSSTNQEVVFPPVDGSSAPATATTTPADSSAPGDSSTTGVKTPQQIFEQLQRLRQQQTQSTTPQ